MVVLARTHEDPSRFNEDSRDVISIGHRGRFHPGPWSVTPLSRLGRSPSTLLFAILVPLAVVTILGLVTLWPSGELPDRGIVDLGGETHDAVIVSAAARDCTGVNEDRRPDGTIPATVSCALVTARVVEGADRGIEVDVYSPSTVPVDELAPGTPIVLIRYPATQAESAVWVWQDFARVVPLGVLAGAYALVVILVAGMRGLRSLLGLAVAFAIIGMFMLPALLQGRDPSLVGLVASSAIMFVVLYLAHGFSHRTTTALLGTLAGLGVTAVLGAVAARIAHLDGINNEESYQLALLTGRLSEGGLRGIFLAGVILAGLGVLNDVTITQASAVWELREADATASRRSLFSRAMRIGRDHIASTVYTMAFAYAGAALPVMLLLQVYQRPLISTITSGEFAEEIARTAVGSIGLVLAIPLTTFIAVLVATARPVRWPRHRDGAGTDAGAPVPRPRALAAPVNHAVTEAPAPEVVTPPRSTWTSL